MLFLAAIAFGPPPLLWLAGLCPHVRSFRSPLLTHVTSHRTSTTGKRNDDDQAKERLYTLVTPVLGITNFHGLQTTVIDQE